MKKHISSYTRWKVGIFLFLALLGVQALLLFPRANAAGLVSTMVRFNRMTTSTPTTGTVCAGASSAGAGTEASVKVTFPTGYTVSSTVGDWSVSTATTTGWPSGATAWPSIAAPTGSGDFVISGQSVTFQSGDLTDTTVHCFNWTSSAAVSIKSSATNDNTGSVVTQAAGASAIDTGNYATSSLSNDQISVSATVNPSFTFSITGGNSANLSALSTSTPTEYTGLGTSVSTNAATGWQVWAADLSSTKGLHSTSANYTIASGTGGYSPAAGGAGAALTGGTEGFNLGNDALSGGTCGTPTYGNFYNGGTQYKGSGLDGTMRTLVSTTGGANNCALPLKINAAIAGNTPAATDYSATITLVGAGLF